GEQGGRVLYSGPPAGLAGVAGSQTARYLFERAPVPPRTLREPSGWLRLEGVSRNNLDGVDVAFPLGVFTTVTGVSGSGKSSLVSQVLVELLSGHLGQSAASEAEETEHLESAPITRGGRISEGLEQVRRLVTVDQKPI